MDWLIHDPLTRFVAQVAVIVAVARALGVLARRVGQPIVVAEIIAGIVLGPSVLGRVAPGVLAGLFPAGSLELLRFASELGLVLFMFLVGLELDPAMLRGRVRASLAVALASLAVPFALGAALAVPLAGLVGAVGSTWVFALFLGTAMSVTALPVLARLLADQGLLRTGLGTLALACAAFDDAAAWCLLAFVVGCVRADGAAGALATTGLALAFVAVMLGVVAPILRRLVARRAGPVAVTHDVLAVAVIAMLVSAWITERIGIHLVFGAFLFGAIVPRRDGLARALAEKLEDVVVVVLLPVFFALSGLRTDVHLVASAGHLVACAAIIVVACAGKLGGSVLAARGAGLAWREAGALGVLMNTRGLMELIVINLGFELGVFSPAIFSMLVVMVVVTTLAATPILRRVYPASEAARDALAADPPPRPSGAYRVLACISREDAGPAMATMTHALGGPGAELIALHLARTPEEEAADVLEPALARATELGLAARPLAFASAEPAGDIVRIADVRDPALVLLAVRADAAVPELVHEVLRRVRTAVAVQVDRGGADPVRVLVPLAGGADDRAALGHAAAVQRATGAALTVLQVVRARRPAAAARAAIAQLERAGARFHVESAIHALPAEAVIERAAAFDLVIAGASLGLGPDGRVLPCAASLLVVRAASSERASARVQER